jgi:hypothetical protein
MLTCSEADSKCTRVRERSRRVTPCAAFARLARALIGVMLVATAAVACGGERITGPASQAPTRKFVIDQPLADILRDNNSSESSVTVLWEEENKCNGDLVTGRMKASFALFTSDTDVEHLRIHTHWVADGTATITGNVYHGASEDNLTINSSSDPLAPRLEWTQVHVERLTSPTAPDMRVKFLFHITVSATGKPTASVEKGSPVDPECSK